MLSVFVKPFPVSTAHRGRHASSVEVSAQGRMSVTTVLVLLLLEVCHEAVTVPRGPPT